jgi:hypothetical protein
MGCRTYGISDLWDVALVGRRTCGMSDLWDVGLMGGNQMSRSMFLMNTKPELVSNEY